VLLAAFLVAGPYLSSALKQGYSILSGSTTTGPGTQTSSTAQYNATSAISTTSYASCSSAVSVKSLSAPDIRNETADVSYPSDYCTLANYALGLINQDRSANGTGPVTLSFNQAAQQHADSMLYYGYFSHNDTQGYKPYMRYTLLGGRGADFENVAYFYYSLPHFLTTSSVEDAIKSLEYSMVNNDNSCCANGHRYNILAPIHNEVSIGVAYNSTYVYFDEEFENDYVSLTFTTASSSSSSPYYVTMKGVPTQAVTAPGSIYVTFDSTPAATSRDALNSGPHEYGPGTFVGGVLPRTGFLGDCGQFTTGTTVCADTWHFSSSSVDIAFALEPFIKSNGPGAYTIYLLTGSDTGSSITSISVFVT